MEKKGYAEVFATPPPSIVHSSKQGMGQPESDQERRSKRLCRAVFWLGVIAAAPVLMWCCDRGLNEVHRRLVIRCFRAADRVIVEYAVVKPDDSGDPYTTHEITNREQLALIAQHVSRIQIDEFQSKFLFFPFLVGTTANWGLPDKVSVYNSHDVTPRQFCISPDCLYEIGREGRVFFHTGEAFRRALRAR